MPSMTNGIKHEQEPFISDLSRRPQTTIVTVFSAGEDEWTVPEFQALLAEAIEKVPAERRGDIKIGVEHRDYYTLGGLSIYYTITETPEEVEKRLAGQ